MRAPILLLGLQSLLLVEGLVSMQRALQVLDPSLCLLVALLPLQALLGCMLAYLDLNQRDDAYESASGREE